MYAQNEDCSVHEGFSGNPPKWIQKKLEELKKWSWTDNQFKPGEITPRPSNRPTDTPSPSPHPTPAPGPAPVVIPPPDKQAEEYQVYYVSNGLTVSDAIAGIGIGGLIYLSIKLFAAIPTGGWSLVLP